MTAERGFFWVNVETQAAPHGTVPNGQMYVEHLLPAEVTRPYPVVLVHGGGGQGLDWLGTPDGRPGWAQGLVEAGFEVYVVDRPGHGRSPYHPDLLGPMFPPPTYEFLQDIFTPATDSPPGEGHSQWPGGREPGDEAMDQFMPRRGRCEPTWPPPTTSSSAALPSFSTAPARQSSSVTPPAGRRGSSPPTPARKRSSRCWP